MDELLRKIKEESYKLLVQHHKHFSLAHETPKTNGVYLVHKTTEPDKGIVYVGVGNLYGRIYLSHYSGEQGDTVSGLRKKLAQKYNVPLGPKMKNWLAGNCRFSFLEIEPLDLANVVEYALIADLRSKGHPLLNN